MKNLFRWRAIAPLSLLLAILGAGWLLFLDTLVEHTIEDLGAELLGAKFDIESADVDLAEGRVRLSGVAAANPDSPMSNLFEADEFVADVRMAPLLKKKVVIQEAALRGLRFGTARTTSGKLDNPRPGSGRLARELSGWANSIKVPPLTLAGIGQTVDVTAIREGNLKTLAAARATTAFADSARRVWEGQLNDLDPTSLIDSSRKLVAELNGANPLTLGLAGGARLLASGPNTITSINRLQGRLTALDSTVRSGMTQLRVRATELASARQADYQYAWGLLKLPSLNSPDVSPSIFGEMAVSRIKPVLYWMNRAAEYLPPGLDPRSAAGPKRARQAGTTVTFPGQEEYPQFLLESADLDLEIAGEGVAAGRYSARIAGLTTEPAIYGKPLTASLQRAAGTAGPRGIKLDALLDHTGSQIHDSVSLSLTGLALPPLELSGVGARLDLGEGGSELAFSMRGDSISGRWLWRSNEATWARSEGASADNLVQGFLWRTVSALRNVTIDVRFSGSPRRPSLRIGSNIGRAIASSLKQQLGAEINRARGQMRAQVDRLVGSRADEAQSKVALLQANVEQRLGSQLADLQQVRGELEKALRKIGRF